MNLRRQDFKPSWSWVKILGVIQDFRGSRCFWVKWKLTALSEAKRASVEVAVTAAPVTKLCKTSRD